MNIENHTINHKKKQEKHGIKSHYKPQKNYEKRETLNFLSLWKKPIFQICTPLKY